MQKKSAPPRFWPPINTRKPRKSFSPCRIFAGIALSEEGEAAYELVHYLRAERCFGHIPALIELFTYEEKEGKCQYWWAGMQTFHSFACLGLAAAKRKLGKMSEAEEAAAKAYRILSTSWDDFEERREIYLQPFREYEKKFEDTV